MITRHILPKVQRALSYSPVVLLQGPRQCGKSTLAKALTADSYQYVTLDDFGQRALAQNDPLGYLRSLGPRAIIDEVQYAPDLMSAIKILVDNDRQPGRFVLTGSTQVLLLPAISESLAGRIATVTLWPFSQGEIRGGNDNFVDRIFADDFQWQSNLQGLDRPALINMLLTGGFPTSVTLKDIPTSRQWMDDYINTVVMRNIQDLSLIDRILDVPKLLAQVAARASGLINYTDMARDVGLATTTLKRYLALLQLVFLTVTLPPWHHNKVKRTSKSPKLCMVDSGLHAKLLDVNADNLMNLQSQWIGPLLENFVAMELIKQTGWSQKQVTLQHFRDYGNKEVDLVLEGPRGDVVGIEVKAADSGRTKDLRGLEAMRDALGKNFVRGVVLHTGDHMQSLGDRIIGMPISGLWT